MQAFKVFMPRNGSLSTSIFHKMDAQGVMMGKYIFPRFGMFFVFDTLENAERWTRYSKLKNLELHIWEVDVPEAYPIRWEAVYRDHFEEFWSIDEGEFVVLVQRPPTGTLVAPAMQLVHQIW